MDECSLLLSYTIAAWVTAVATSLLTLTVFFAASQARAARRTIKAQALMKLFDEWRSPDIYRSMSYVNRLRADWKQKAHPSGWQRLAEEWVAEHAGKNPESPDPEEKRLWGEWASRRAASQFLAKMGALILAGYLTAGEFFDVDPEVGRQLAVLWPIEVEVQKYFAAQEGTRIAQWDHPVPKWEFAELWKAYERWYPTNACRLELRAFVCGEDTPKVEAAS